MRPATEEGASEQRLAVGPACRPGRPARGDRYQRRAHRPRLRLLARRLTSGSEGATAYFEEDLRNVAEIVPAAGGTLDFTKPVAVMLIGVLQCIPDEDDPAGIVGRLMDAVPSGSYLAISHPGYDIYGPGPRNLASRLNELMPAKLRFRSHAEVARFFEGLDLVEPGLVRVPEWRPDSDADRANPAAVWGGVARKN